MPSSRTPRDTVASAPAYTTTERLVAEALGTFLLVFGSIGTALFAADFGASDAGTSLGVGFVGVALAFGLTLLAGIYTWGPGASRGRTHRATSPPSSWVARSERR
jgi:aquaporin Z